MYCGNAPHPGDICFKEKGIWDVKEQKGWEEEMKHWMNEVNKPVKTWDQMLTWETASDLVRLLPQADGARLLQPGVSGMQLVDTVPANSQQNRPCRH